MPNHGSNQGEKKKKALSTSQPDQVVAMPSRGYQIVERENIDHSINKKTTLERSFYVHLPLGASKSSPGPQFRPWHSVYVPLRVSLTLDPESVSPARSSGSPPA